MEVMTPTNFRKDMYNLLKEIAESNRELEITLSGKNEVNDGVVMISKREWQALQEELYLQETGTLNYVLGQMEVATDDDFVEL